MREVDLGNTVKVQHLISLKGFCVRVPNLNNTQYTIHKLAVFKIKGRAFEMFKQELKLNARMGLSVDISIFPTLIYFMCFVLFYNVNVFLFSAKATNF